MLLRDNKVYMRKRCPDCGPFEALVYGDAQAYTSHGRYNKPGTIPLAFGGEVRDGCPHDCGLCPDHQQHTCLGIIEVNSACNMNCPLCFSDASPGFNLTLEEVEQMLDDYVRTEGNPEVVQFSGGEPTIHPQIIDFVRAAKARNIPFVMINTNGKRIAKDDRFLEQLNEVRPSLYFQFDGFESETYRDPSRRAGHSGREAPRAGPAGANRPERHAGSRHRARRERARDRPDHRVSRSSIRPCVESISSRRFTPDVTLRHDPMQRMTIPDILQLIETQTAGKFTASDFVPVPCCFPTCNSVTYAFIDGDQVTPLPRIVNVHDYLDYITNRVMPDLSLEIKGALEGLWSSSSVAGSQKSADQLAFSCQACGIPESLTVGDIAQHMIMIMLQDFMDPWTFNQKNLMKCCKEFLLPGGKQIPFCAYNTIGYREQARSAAGSQGARAAACPRRGPPVRTAAGLVRLRSAAPRRIGLRVVVIMNAPKP